MSGQTIKQRDWTERRRSRFLAALRETGNVTAAAKRSSVPRGSAYALRAADAEFRAAWDDAMESALDDLEAELRRRAMEGTEKSVYYAGKKVGTARSYSDSMAMFLLRSRRPHLYGEKAATLPAGEMVTEDAATVRQKLEAKLARLEEAVEKEDGE